MGVSYSRTAQRALLTSNKRVLIAEKIKALADTDWAQNPNVVRLQGREEFRLRVQDWRVIFRVENAVLLIDDIGPRGSIYLR